MLQWVLDMADLNWMLECVSFISVSYKFVVTESPFHLVAAVIRITFQLVEQPVFQRVIMWFKVLSLISVVIERY